MTAPRLVTALPVIQVRVSSTRFPGKCFAMTSNSLGGASTMLSVVVKNAREAFGSAPVLAVPLNERALFETWGRMLGCDVIGGHPTNLLDRFCTVALERPNAEYFARITADDPDKNPWLCQMALNICVKQPHHCKYADTNHYPNLVGYGCEVFNREALFEASLKDTGIAREHLTIGMRLRAEDRGIVPVIRTVDTPDDL